MTLPESTQRDIEAAAHAALAVAFGDEGDPATRLLFVDTYIRGATEWAKRAQGLLEALGQIQRVAETVSDLDGNHITGEDARLLMRRIAERALESEGQQEEAG